MLKDKIEKYLKLTRYNVNKSIVDISQGIADIIKREYPTSFVQKENIRLQKENAELKKQLSEIKCLNRDEVIKFIDDRINYLVEYRVKANDYSNGFSSIESGPCCDKCKMDKEAAIKEGRAVLLRLAVGCKDPFQINCKCHIPYRKVATAAEINLLKEIKWYFETRPDLLSLAIPKLNKDRIIEVLGKYSKQISYMPIKVEPYNNNIFYQGRLTEAILPSDFEQIADEIIGGE